MGALKAYSCTFNNVIISGAQLSRSWQIVSVNREMKLLSITWDLEIQNSATLKRVSWEANTDTIALLQIGTAANQVAIPYSNFNVAPAYNGSIFQIFNPGQYIFKTFFIKNTLDIFLLLTNYNANSANYRSTIIIETDEKIIYQ